MIKKIDFAFVLPIAYFFIAVWYLIGYYYHFGVYTQLGFFFLPVLIVFVLAIVQKTSKADTVFIPIKGLVAVLILSVWGNSYSPITAGRIVPLWVWLSSVIFLLLLTYIEFLRHTAKP